LAFVVCVISGPIEVSSHLIHAYTSVRNTI
jgi:hypothetical protein